MPAYDEVDVKGAENGHKEHEEKGYPGLGPLPNYTPEIHRGAGQEDAEGSKYHFSKFLFQQAEMQQQLYGFLTMGRITSEQELLLMHRLFGLFLVEWEADATNREGRYQEEERLAKIWQSEMGSEQVLAEDEQGNKIQTVDDLLEDWHAAAAYMSHVYVKKRRRGLAYVQDCRDKYMQAQQAQDAAEYAAAALPPAHNQYFWCRVRQLQIMMDRTEDLALGVPVKDYTSVKKQLSDGVSVHRVATLMPWAFRIAYGRVFNSIADGDRIRKHLAILYTQQWPLEQRPPKKSSMFGLGPRKDRDEDDEDAGNTRRDRGGRRREDEDD